MNYTDAATGAAGTATAQTYSGPVAGLHWQYIWPSPDGVAIRSTAPDVVLHGAAGADARAVPAGSNVLDSGGGSNFLVGGAGFDGGHDTFYIDTRGGAVTWSTIVNFHLGDTATIFGFHAGVSTRPWTGSERAIGYNGLTLHSETKSGEHRDKPLPDLHRCGPGDG